MCIDEHSLPSLHSRAAEGKPTHTKPLTLNIVPIIWEQKFRDVREKPEKDSWRRDLKLSLEKGSGF